jgi:ATP synthase F1 gamma subunit
MLPAIHIKKTIDFNKNFSSLLEVLKLVAVSEYYRLEKSLKTFEPLKEVVNDFFNSIDLTNVNHPFLNPGDKPICVLAVTSDAGLLGGINNQVISKAVDLLRAEEGRLVVIGDRGVGYAQGFGASCISYPGILDHRRFAQSQDIRDFVIRKVISGEYGGLKVVYPRAHSFVVHRVEVETLLPFSLSDDTQADKGKAAVREVIFESSPPEVVEYLVHIVIGQRLFEIFGMSRVCEQAARYLHLEESCNKIGEMNKKLYLQYFRRRHEVIDANMRELFAARVTTHDK